MLIMSGCPTCSTAVQHQADGQHARDEQQQQRGGRVSENRDGRTHHGRAHEPAPPPRAGATRATRANGITLFYLSSMLERAEVDSKTDSVITLSDYLKRGRLRARASDPGIRESILISVNITLGVTGRRVRHKSWLMSPGSLRATETNRRRTARASRTASNHVAGQMH